MSNPALTHLAFRGLGTLDEHPRLRAFCDRLGDRASSLATPYHFDQPPDAMNGRSKP